jgi:hypothetical protein
MATTRASIRAYRSEIKKLQHVALDRGVSLSAMIRAEMAAYLRGERDIEDMRQDREKMIYTSILVDDDVLTQFKAFCVEKDIAFEEALRTAMRSIIFNVDSANSEQA